MATELLFRENAYIKEFNATVKKCREKDGKFEIILDKTAFYPEGGGQPGDRGFLGETRVIDTHEKDGEVIHFCEFPLEEGRCVKGTIDWETRFDHMQHHSAEHIVSGIVNRRFGYDNVGFHMGSIVTVDFNGPLTPDEVLSVEKEANEAVWKNIEILETYPSDEELKAINYRSKKELTGQVRIVSIPGSDVCACCGTHVKRTGEIGLIKLSFPVKYKNGVRIEVLAGSKALCDYDKKDSINLNLSRLFSAKPFEVSEAAEMRMEEIERLKAKIKELQNQIFLTTAERFKDEDTPLFLEKELEAAELKDLCLALMKKRKGVIMLFAPSDKGPSKFVLGASDNDIKEKSREMLKNLNAKGGGSSSLIQGVINSSSFEAEKLFKETFK